jgi:fatty acid-binding protein DegV
MKLLPVLTQTRDKTRIKPLAIRRSWKGAVETIFQRLHELEVGAEHRISVCHAGARLRGEGILRQVRQRFPTAETELLELSPALITHGGPGCIVIQAIRK